MARPKSSTESKIKKGRGTGHGRDYLPFLTVRDFGSEGKVSRAKGWKTQRVHHFFSSHELNYFYALEWAPFVVDIREQFPLLPLESTLEIAERLGIPHPRNPQTQEPEVMTTDFVIDEVIEGELIISPRAVKPVEKLGGKRVVEKLEIERTYWAEQKKEWGIVTEREIPKALSQNVEWIHDALPLEVPEKVLQEVESTLFDSLQVKSAEPLSYLSLAVDEILGLPGGTSLWALRHLIATRKWEVDMLRLIDPSQPLVISRAVSGSDAWK